MLTILLAGAACTTWQTTGLPTPKQAGPDWGRERQLRITQHDGYVITLQQARLLSDSLVGFAATNGTVRRAFAVADVARVEVRKTDVERTIWAVTGTVLLVGSVVAATVAASTWELYGGAGSGRLAPQEHVPRALPSIP
jgi:hypothetical protein